MNRSLAEANTNKPIPAPFRIELPTELSPVSISSAEHLAQYQLCLCKHAAL